MSVLDGRGEIRRILDGGSPQWVTPSDDGSELVLMDGRRARSQRHLPALRATRRRSCASTSTTTRGEWSSGPTVDHSHVLPKPTTALNSHRRAVPARRLPVDELRGRGRRRHRSSHAQRRPRRRVGAPGRLRLRGDVGLHDFRETDAGSMLRVKGQDGYCPIGPGLVWGVDIRESMRGPTSTVRSSRRARSRR